MSALGEIDDCETVRWLIELGVDVNHSDTDGFNAVHCAAEKGNLDVLKVLRNSGEDIHQVNRDGINSIMQASLGSGDCETVRWLIEQGVDVNHSDKDGSTAVHCAAQKGNLDVLKLLHNSETNIHQVDNKGNNSILYALWGTGDYDIVRWLVEQGVDVNHSNDDGFSAVHCAAEKGNLNVLKLLHNSEVNIHQVLSNGKNSIMSALFGNGDYETVRWLVEQGLDVNHSNKDGFTAAHCAALKGNLNVLKLLHNSGANIQQQNNRGKNSIMFALSGTGDSDTVRWLLEQGVNVNHSNKDGLTAVHYAAQQGNVNVLKLLQHRGANIDQVDSTGTNSIMFSLTNGDCETVRWLTENGVDVNVSDYEGITAVHGAACLGKLEVLKLLHKSGANIRQKNSYGQNSIMLASTGTSDCETVRWLIEHGVDVNDSDKLGKTAVHYAAQKGNIDVLKLLHNKGAYIHEVANSTGVNSIIAALQGTNSKFFLWLIEQDVNVNCFSFSNLTSVFYADVKGNMDLLNSSKCINRILSASEDTGHCAIVRWLIEKGVDVNHSDKFGLTAVHHAACVGNLEVLKMLHSRGVSMRQVNHEGINSIIMALLGTGDCETVRWLIEQGVDVNHSDKFGSTAVQYATQKGNFEVLKLLHNSEARIHHVNNNGINSIIMASLGTGDCETVRWLIEQGVDVNHSEKSGSTAVLYAAQQGNLKVLKLLHNREAKIHQVNNNGTNSIIAASLGTGDCETVRWLIEQGVDVNHSDKFGSTAVQYATQKGNFEVLKLLHNSRANIRQANNNGINSIIMASLGSGDCETVRWLIEQGIDVNHSDNFSSTAVHYAAQHSNLDVLKLLHSNGANINEKKNNGTNSIMLASRGTRVFESVRCLIEQGIDSNLFDRFGLTAVPLTMHQDNLEVLKLLHSTVTNIHQMTSNADNIISMASLIYGDCETVTTASLGSGDCETVRWLVEQGGDVNHSNKDGFTAVHCAAEGGNMDVLKLLDIYGANIHKVSDEGINAIMSVSQTNGDCGIAMWLIDHGVKKSQCTNTGVTAVHLAARMNHLSLLKLLKQHSFDIHSLDGQKNDAVMWNTSGKGDEIIVQWLINEGLDVNHCNIHGNCALHFASYCGMLSVVRMLCSLGANINNQNNHCENALQFAAQGKSTLETVVWLIENNIDVSNLNDEGRSALHFAAAQNQTEILKYIAGYDKRISLKSHNR